MPATQTAIMRYMSAMNTGCKMHIAASTTIKQPMRIAPTIARGYAAIIRNTTKIQFWIRHEAAKRKYVARITPIIMFQHQCDLIDGTPRAADLESNVRRIARQHYDETHRRGDDGTGGSPFPWEDIVLAAAFLIFVIQMMTLARDRLKK